VNDSGRLLLLVFDGSVIFVIANIFPFGGFIIFDKAMFGRILKIIPVFVRSFNIWGTMSIFLIQEVVFMFFSVQTYCYNHQLCEKISQLFSL